MDRMTMVVPYSHALGIGNSPREDANYNADVKYIGYWRDNEQYRFLPDVWDYLDDDLADGPPPGLEEFITKLEASPPFRHYLGSSTCRLCGISNGNRDMSLDGTWVYPEGFVHYIKVHGLIPPSEFVNHVLNTKPKPLREVYNVVYKA